MTRFSNGFSLFTNDITLWGTLALTTQLLTGRHCRWMGKKIIYISFKNVMSKRVMSNFFYVPAVVFPLWWYWKRERGLDWSEISNADCVTAWQQNMALDIKRMPFIPCIWYLVVLMLRFIHYDCLRLKCSSLSGKIHYIVKFIQPTKISSYVKGSIPDFKMEKGQKLLLKVDTVWSKLIPSFPNAFNIQLLYRKKFKNMCHNF